MPFDRLFMTSEMQTTPLIDQGNTSYGLSISVNSMKTLHNATVTLILASAFVQAEQTPLFCSPLPGLIGCRFS
jgi:hypothetical protein